MQIDESKNTICVTAKKYITTQKNSTGSAQENAASESLIRDSSLGMISRLERGNIHHFKRLKA